MACCLFTSGKGKNSPKSSSTPTTQETKHEDTTTTPTPPKPAPVVPTLMPTTKQTEHKVKTSPAQILAEPVTTKEVADTPATPTEIQEVDLKFESRSVTFTTEDGKSYKLNVVDINLFLGAMKEFVVGDQNKKDYDHNVLRVSDYSFSVFFVILVFLCYPF